MNNNTTTEKTYWATQAYPFEAVEIGVCEISGMKIVKNKYPPEISLTLHTYIFNSEDEAYTYADRNGAFDECHGKEQWCERYDEDIFEITEDDFKDYEPLIFMNKGSDNEKD